MSFISEFKEFAMRGNVIDMAVGVGKIVSSLVGDIIMPVVGAITGGVNFTDLKLTLKEAAEGAPAVTINYGSFIQTMVDFLIIAFCIFCVIKALNTLKNKLPKEEEAAPAEPETPADIALLTEIRDLLKK